MGVWKKKGERVQVMHISSGTYFHQVSRYEEATTFPCTQFRRMSSKWPAVNELSVGIKGGRGWLLLEEYFSIWRGVSPIDDAYPVLVIRCPLVGHYSCIPWSGEIFEILITFIGSHWSLIIAGEVLAGDCKASVGMSLHGRLSRSSIRGNY